MLPFQAEGRRTELGQSRVDNHVLGAQMLVLSR